MTDYADRLASQERAKVCVLLARYLLVATAMGDRRGFIFTKTDGTTREVKPTRVHAHQSSPRILLFLCPMRNAWRSCRIANLVSVEDADGRTMTIPEVQASLA